jgi:hypothetical protein
MKKALFIFFTLFIFKSIKSQEVLIDKWQTIATNSLTSTMQDYNTSLLINNKIIFALDTLNPGMYNESGLFSYDINTRAINSIPFTHDLGDRGIKCATSYKTVTPGLEYGIFGCFSHSDTGPSYPILYTYNSQTGTVVTDSLHDGSHFNYDGGIQNIAMYSPSTNNDTMRVFSYFNVGTSTSVFSKHINQSSFTLGTSNQINIDYVKTSAVYGGTLFIGGSYLDQPCFLQSTDGRNFTPVAGFNPSSFPQYSFINVFSLFNNMLYYSVSEEPNYFLYNFDGTSHTLVQTNTSSEIIKSFTVYKNKLWFNTSSVEPLSVISNIYSIDANDNIDTSAIQYGYQDVDGTLLQLISTKDSLYFMGNKGTYSASKAAPNTTLFPQQLKFRYMHVAKLNLPIASFNYNNNIICLNAMESFTSTSQFTDSLHWLLNGAYHASSPGASAYMNYNFPIAGTHTIGLVAFGGNFTDTFNLQVTVYGINTSIAATNTLICFNSSVSGNSVLTQTTTGTIGGVNYQWMRDLPPTVVGTGTSYTYTPGSFGSTYSFWLQITDSHGCTALSNTIAIGTNPLYDIDGNLYTGNTPTITSVIGDVILYKYQPTLGMFDSITYLTTTNFGYYDFTGIDEGEYILKAVPSANSLQISYFGNDAVTWKDAVSFNHTCLNPTTNTINIIPLANIGVGPGQLSGHIYEAFGFGQKSASDDFKPLVPGNPIGGIIVKGGKNPGGQMFVQTTTAADGSYTLTGIPISSTDDYFVMVDIPGLDTNGTYHRQITVSNTNYTGLDFTIDSMYINPSITTGIKNLTNEKEQILLFPNPAKNYTKLKMNMMNESYISCEIYNTVGEKVIELCNNEKHEKGTIEKIINLNNLSSGVYFIKTKINNLSSPPLKLIITN